MFKFWFKFILLLNLVALISSYVPPKLILISFDAFRSDYLHPKLTPTMYQLAKEGVFTQRMKSCYPTKTFPNHFSIVTGLYEENHGIVNNKMYDSKFNATFDQVNLEERWWNDMNVKPIWKINEQFNKDRVSASYMWPGSPAPYNGEKLKHVVKFKDHTPIKERVDKVIEWLTMDEPANFVLLYVEEPDETSHQYGPFSKEVRDLIKKLDDSIEYLIKRLKEVALLDETNLVILSDHGMSELREERVLTLTKLCDSKDLIVSGVSPNLNVFVSDKSNIDKIYNQLFNASKELPFTVYKREDIPARFHFNNHRRVGDIFIEGDDEFEVVLNQNKEPFNQEVANEEIEKMKAKIEKYADVNKPTNSTNIIDKFDDFEKRKKNSTLHYWGEHGYDNNIENMRPLFLAHGPAFKKNYIHRKPFENIDVYSLCCSVLHLNLDEKDRQPNDPYCRNDGQPWRVQKMLEPIKFEEKDLSSGSDKKSYNILSILLLGSSLLVLSGCLFTLCTAAASRNSNYKKRELLNMDLNDDVVDIDLFSYQRQKVTNNETTKDKDEERVNLINDNLDFV